LVKLIVVDEHWKWVRWAHLVSSYLVKLIVVDEHGRWVRWAHLVTSYLVKVVDDDGRWVQWAHLVTSYLVKVIVVDEHGRWVWWAHLVTSCLKIYVSGLIAVTEPTTQVFCPGYFCYLKSLRQRQKYILLTAPYLKIYFLKFALILCTLYALNNINSTICQYNLS